MSQEALSLDMYTFYHIRRGIMFYASGEALCSMVPSINHMRLSGVSCMHPISGGFREEVRIPGVILGAKSVCVKLKPNGGRKSNKHN